MKKQTTYSIGQVAQRYKVSRSTLIYYEKIELLKVSARTASGYRQYTQKDLKTLQSILLYRSTGVPLEQIKQLIQSNQTSSSLTEILQQRLAQTNQEICKLKEQQQLLLDLLNQDATKSSGNSLNKQMWTDMLRKAGLDEQGMSEWHRQFEMQSPIEHQKFLQSLGLSTAEIKKIRTASAV